MSMQLSTLTISIKLKCDEIFFRHTEREKFSSVYKALFCGLAHTDTHAMCVRGQFKSHVRLCLCWLLLLFEKCSIVSVYVARLYRVISQSMFVSLLLCCGAKGTHEREYSVHMIVCVCMAGLVCKICCMLISF